MSVGAEYAGAVHPGEAVSLVKILAHMNTVTKGLVSLVVLGILAFTLSSVVFSGASFTAKSSNPGNLFVAGTLSHVNDQEGKVVLNAAGLAPGAVRSGTMTLYGTGDVSGVYALTVSSRTDGPAGASLAGALTLTVEEVAASTTTLYQGTLADLAVAPISLGKLAPAQARACRFTLTYPMANASAALSGASTALELLITGVSL